MKTNNRKICDHSPYTKQCDKLNACRILGQCVFLHENIKGNEAAIIELASAHGIKKVLNLFHRHTKRRMIFSGGKGPAIVFNPAPSPEAIAKELNSTMQEVSKIIYQADKRRMRFLKRTAAEDAAAGYVYDQSHEHKNFNE